MHSVYFAQYDAPVSIYLYRCNKKKGWKQGYISEKITDLKFENHKDVKKCILLTLKQAEANICSMGYQNSNLKIGLSLFGCAQKYTEQSTHFAMGQQEALMER